MTSEILNALKLEPGDVPQLPAKGRNALIAYLIRWEHFEAARDCLVCLLETHDHLLTAHDNLARVYTSLDKPELALATIARRHELKVSNASRILEAKALLGLGDLLAAQEIAQELTTQMPGMVSAWGLLAEVNVAATDWAGAERALDQQQALQPESTASAWGRARLWQARGDIAKGLLWARTAVSRAQTSGRAPPAALLRLLGSLYQADGQSAQAQATAALLQEQQSQDLEALRPAVGLAYITPDGGAFPRDSAPAVPGTPPGLSKIAELTPGEHSRLLAALVQHFGHDGFRPGQAEAIAAVLRGESVLAVMPTGAGKSLCYQLAALLLPGTTLVVSPLIALMKDQVDGLPESVACQATTLNSTLDSLALNERMSRAAAGGYKLVYAAPERLRQRPFLHALKQAGVSLLVVDEAHCVSLWGHDFRPDYRFIAKAWHELGEPPILAMTATATPRVQDDIQSALGRMQLVATDIHRPNLSLEGIKLGKKREKNIALLSLCQEIEGSGIVYANSRDACEQLASMLRRHGVTAIHYHAGIRDRAAAQDRFMSGQARVVVATIAFGMGIDKPDVRFIIHYSPPKALENYYQEAGRAGRDGLPARCILFHTSHDKGNLTRWLHQDAIQRGFLREVYAAVQRRLRGRDAGLVAVGDLERDLDADPTSIRVAVHFLETAKLLWRGFDLPRTASLSLNRPPQGSSEVFAAFVGLARLRPRQTVSRDLVELAQAAAGQPELADLLEIRALENQLLEWDRAGWLGYRGIGRDMLLALPRPPSDSRQRVEALLADHAAGLEARANAMMAYANTRLCRHGFVSAYFGGRQIDRCPACDNCQSTSDSAARRAVAGRPSPVARSKRGLPDYDEELFQRLRAWRKQVAHEQKRAPFTVAHDTTLQEIAACQPTTSEQLLSVHGIGARKLEVYGASILALVAAHLAAAGSERDG
ncbi:MAG: ATP-dependent DNA helicase [Anaerolineae bacterium]|nr:ATP-dependent DNA helicase [Anaerolineae bacterium]